MVEKGLRLDDDSDSEIALYQKAIELDSKFAPAYYRLADLSPGRETIWPQKTSPPSCSCLRDRQAKYITSNYIFARGPGSTPTGTEEPEPRKVEQEVAAEPAEVESAETAEEARRQARK